VDKEPIEFWYDIGDDVKAPATDSAVAGPPDPAPGRSIRTRLGVSVPGAVVGAFLVCALAFGANLTGSTAPDEPKDQPVAEIEPTGGPDEPYAEEPKDDAEPDATAEVDEQVDEHADATAEPTPKPIEKPEAEATPKPRAEPTPKPTPKPTAKPRLGLVLKIREGAVFIDWTACEVDGADVYKVVRSPDSTVRWPAGENDKVVAAVEVGGATKAWDEHARPGKRAWYRVFCLRSTEAGYRIVALSAAGSIVVPAEPKPTPPPEPSAMWIEVDVEGSSVVIHWEACGSDGFSHYRILRKAGGEASMIAEIENAGTTTYVDESVGSGVEYHYLVQAKGHVGDDWVLLGSTGWAGVTAP